MKNDDAIKSVKEVTGMSLDWDDNHYEALQLTIDALKQTSDKNTKAILLQNYIQQFGAIPDEYGDEVRGLLNGGNSAQTD